MRTELMGWIDSSLFGSVFTLRRANKLVQAKIDKCGVEQFEHDDRLKHSTEDLDAMLTISVHGLERIENKAMGTLLGVAVAIAVFGATSGLLGPDGMLSGSPSVFRIVAATLLLVAMLYLLGSGFLALRAYQVGQVFRPTLSDRTPVAEETQEKMVILYSVEQNQRAATLRSNRLSASFACLRNGLVTVLGIGILIVLAGVLPVFCVCS